MSTERPLAGTIVLDASRMLPGAVLARMLLDLGARVIKVEDPRSGDMMRGAPPTVDGTGAGFRAFYRGAESIALDLRRPADAAALARVAAGVDVLVESFRPGTLAAWGLGPDDLMAAHPGLVVVSLSGFGQRGPGRAGVAHDLNLVASSGLLSLLPGPGLPGVQLADVTTGLLAGSAVLAALLARHRSGRGLWIDQPLASGPLPFLLWARADAQTGEAGLLGSVLAGQSPSYQIYACADGLALAVAVVEPKFWSAMIAELDLPGLADDAFAVGERGEFAIRQVAERFAAAPRAHWLAWAESARLPISPVLDGETALRAGPASENPSFWPNWPADPEAAPVQDLGANTTRVLAEFGVEGFGAHRPT